MHGVRAVLIVVLFSALFSFAQQTTDPAVEHKIDALLKQMTVEEKAGQLSQSDGAQPPTIELIKKGQVGSVFNLLGAENTNAVQQLAVEQGRLKIPLILGYDVIHGYRQIFPCRLPAPAASIPN